MKTITLSPEAQIALEKTLQTIDPANTPKTRMETANRLLVYACDAVVAENDCHIRSTFGWAFSNPAYRFKVVRINDTLANILNTVMEVSK